MGRIPDREALFEGLHKGRDVVHPAAKLGLLGLHEVGTLRLPISIPAGPHILCPGITIENGDTREKFAFCKRLRSRNTNKNVEVVRHHAMSQHFDPRKCRHPPEHSDKNVLFILIQQKLLQRAPADQMVIRSAIDLDTFPSHTCSFRFVRLESYVQMLSLSTLKGLSL